MASENLKTSNNCDLGGQVEIIDNDISTSGDEDLDTEMVMMPLPKTKEGETIFVLPKEEVNQNQEDIKVNPIKSCPNLKTFNE
jgi:hypothetical protein